MSCGAGGFKEGNCHPADRRLLVRCALMILASAALAALASASPSTTIDKRVRTIAWRVPTPSGRQLSSTWSTPGQRDTAFWLAYGSVLRALDHDPRWSVAFLQGPGRIVDGQYLPDSCGMIRLGGLAGDLTIRWEWDWHARGKALARTTTTRVLHAPELYAPWPISHSPFPIDTAQYPEGTFERIQPSSVVVTVTLNPRGVEWAAASTPVPGDNCWSSPASLLRSLAAATLLDAETFMRMPRDTTFIPLARDMTPWAFAAMVLPCGHGTNR